MYSLIDPEIEVQVEIGRVYTFMNDGVSSYLVSEYLCLFEIVSLFHSSRMGV